jgi:oligopeptide transport system substrate-binding protein
MKLYLVYHNSFDFQRAQQALEEYNALWQQLGERNLKQLLPPAQHPYRLSSLKAPIFDPGLCETLFDMEWIKELFCGLAEWSEDRNLIPLAAKHWDVLDGGRRYVFHLREDLRWSDGEPVTAQDFEFAWKRVLDPATHSLVANLLYDILGARDFHQGRTTNSEQVGITVPDSFTLVVELEEPCSYFPYVLGDPVAFAVPKHVVEREGNTWTEPGRIVTNRAFQLESWDQSSENTIHFTRNPHYFGTFKGNIERVTLNFHKNETEMYQSFAAGDLDMVEFLIPPMQQDELKHYQEAGQLHISAVPFVDAIYFVVDRPPFDNPDVRRAFALATDREELAREIKNQIPATGGYIPPGLPGHSSDVSLSYDPQEARRLLAAAGYPQGCGFPPVSLLLGLVGLEKGDNLVFAFLQEMWKENLGITLQKRQHNPAVRQFDISEDFHFFFIGWLADYPDPASFLQTNYVIEQSHWRHPTFDALIEEGRHTFDQVQRMDLYRQADRILMQEAAVLPLFYGHIYELRQPWVHRLTGSSIYSPQWKDITLMPH